MKRRVAILAAGVVAVLTGVWWLLAPGSRGSAASGLAANELRITSAVAKPHHVVVGQTTRLEVRAVRGSGRGGELSYSWRGQGTFGTPEAAHTTWTAPYKVGNYFIRIQVADTDGSAAATVRISVRLPSPKNARSLVNVMHKMAAAQRARLLAKHARADARLAELREQLRKKMVTVRDHVRAQLALEEMGRILKDLGRYEQALAVYKQLRNGVLNTDRKYKLYSASLGRMQFFLGNEAEAIAAYRAAGMYCHGTDRYYLAELLERDGDTDAAIVAYGKASTGSPWFGDPVYRKALLSLENGASADDVATQLVKASPRLDRGRMLERMKTDDELTPLLHTLETTDRVGDLVPQQPLVREMRTPAGSQPPGLNPVPGTSNGGGTPAPAPAPTITASPVPGTGATAPR